MLLAIDDQFLIHDELAAHYLGLRERDVMAGYLVLVGLWLLLNRKVIRRSEWPILATAGMLFALSVAFDYIVQSTMEDPADIGAGLDWGLFIEDGLKFVGIVGWAAYLIRYCYGTVVAARIDSGDPALGS
jgi:hypothetical protein